MRTRDSNLDLLRAIAIVAVVIYHVALMWPTDYASLKPFTGLGKYGVTLFFVLSGWLIGGIFWREQHATGRVRLGNFWSRRWFRTVPPYLVGLTLAYAQVLYGRGDPPDYRFLLFLQNYEEEMPFYLISWSLCVEEHFYLFLPLLGLFCAKLSNSSAAIVVWSLPFAAPLLRCLDPNVDPTAPFGYSHTATHLVSEGLALGVAAAFTRCYFPQRWAAVQKCSSYLALPALIVFFSAAWWDKQAEFTVGQSAIALCCLVWLAASADRPLLPFASSKVVYGIAVTSYSVYLTHMLAIQAAGRLALPTGSLLVEAVTLSIWIATIAIAGRAFYHLVERPSIHLRENVSRWLSATRRLRSEAA